MVGRDIDGHFYWGSPDWDAFDDYYEIEEGYAPRQYYHWLHDSNGVKFIRNDRWNYVMQKYLDDDGTETWDHPRIYDSYGRWEYVKDANGNYPTVSGDGARLIGDGELQNYIDNAGDKVQIYCQTSKDVNYIINSGDHVGINGGAGVRVENTGNGVNIDVGNGRNYVINNGGYERGNNVEIVCGTGDDHVECWCDDYYPNRGITVIGGAGNDSLMNWTPIGLIDGGKNDDYIRNWGYNIIIYGGENNDFVENFATNVSINGGAGNDHISNDDYHKSNNHVTINGGTGSDTIYNSGSYVLIDTTADNEGDYINNGSGRSKNISYVTIKTGAGDDTIDNTGYSSDFTIKNISIDAGDGNDFIRNGGDNVSIDGGTGNDSISSYGNNVSIDGGTGNDSISSGGDNVSIDAGEDNDLVVLENGNNHLVKLGGGSDTIKINNYSWAVLSFSVADWSEDDVIEFDNAVTSVETIDGGTVIDDRITIGGVTIGVEDEIKWRLDENTHVATYGGKTSGGNAVLSADRMSITYKKTTDRSGALIRIGGIADVGGMDPVNKTVNLSPANFTAGGANVMNNTFKYAFALSGDFNGNSFTADKEDDTISSTASNITVNSGAGNDTIYNSGANAVIDAGVDNDHIGNTASSVTVKLGKGNDSVYNTGDSVSIDALDSSDGDKNFIYNDSSFVTITAGAGSESIINNQGGNVAIDVGDGTNEVSIFGGENISVKTGDGENSIIAYGNYTDGLGQVPLVAYGNYSGNYLTIDAGNGKNFISVSSDWYYAKIKGGDSSEGFDKIFNDVDAVSINANKGNDYIENNGDYAVIFGGADGDIIKNYANNVYIHADDNKTAATNRVQNYIYTDKGTNVTIESGNADDIILAYHDIGASISGGDGNDHIVVQRFSAEYINNVIVETAWFAVSNILQAKLLKFGKEFADAIGSKLLGSGLDVIDNVSNIKSFLDPLSGFNEIWDVISPTSTVEGGKGNDVIISDGLAPRTFEYSAGDGMDTIYYFNRSKTENEDLWSMFTSWLLSGTNSLFNLLPTLHIKKGYIEDVEVSYIAGDYTGDLIVRVNDSSIVKIGNESVTLVDSADKFFRLKESDGTLTTRAYGYQKADLCCTIFASANGMTVKDTINAENTRYVIYGYNGCILYGNDKNDTLYGNNKNTLHGGKGSDIFYGEYTDNVFFGEDGDDTIYSMSYSTINGGKDNDCISIKGSAHKNIIQYHSGDGHDIIYGLKGTDTIQIYGSDYTTSVNDKNEFVIEVDDGSITIKDWVSFRNMNIILINDTTPVEPTPVEPTPVEPTPVEPTPVEPTPVEPTPVEPTPVEPTPIEPTPVEPTPVEPTPIEPTPVEPTPVEPTPVEPTPVEPTPVEPTPVEPTPVEPTPVEPTPVEPTPVEPTPVEPTPVEPTPVEPTPVEPTPVEPTPVEPTPVEPTLEGATVIDGTAVTISSDDKEIFIGKRGASLKGYTLDKAFVINAANAQELIDSGDFTLDKNIFYAKGQSPIVLEDYDTSRGTFVNIKTADGRKTIFGWSPQSGGVVDGNDIDKSQVIFGDAPNGNSTIRGGNRNDSIYAGARDVVSLSGGHDELHINDETSQGVTVDMGDGSAQSRTRIVDGFDVTRDLLKIDSPENINARILDGSLQFIKGDSRVTFDELATFDDANGLQLQIDGRTYELRNDYDSGLADVDYFWTDTDGNYYITDSTFRIHDDGSTREYTIGEGSGRLTIDGFNFGRDKDKLNLNSINGLKTYGDNLYVESGDSDVVEVMGGAGKTIDVKLDGTTYTTQLGKHLTYDLDAEYYGDLQGGTGCAISVGANFAQEEVAIYLNEEEEADGKIRYYGGVTKIDASAFTGRASLVGSEFNDKIIAAQGATSLWGGEAGDDELFGTGSDNSFFYCKGNGDDKIYNAANGDSVNLVDITLEDITNSAISDGAVTLELSDGGRLTVMNSADVTFNLGDGTSWKADRQSKEWQQQA